MAVSRAGALTDFLKDFAVLSGVHDWSKDPWAGMCEHMSYRPGELGPFWPEVARPLGRVHFAGAYAAQMSWGQKAELESANRVVSEIDKA